MRMHVCNTCDVLVRMHACNARGAFACIHYMHYHTYLAFKLINKCFAFGINECEALELINECEAFELNECLVSELNECFAFLINKCELDEYETFKLNECFAFVWYEPNECSAFILHKNPMLSVASCNNFVDENRPCDDAGATKRDAHRGESEIETPKNLGGHNSRGESDSRVDTLVKFATNRDDFAPDSASKRVAVFTRA